MTPHILNSLLYGLTVDKTFVIEFTTLQKGSIELFVQYPHQYLFRILRRYVQACNTASISEKLQISSHSILSYTQTKVPVSYFFFTTLIAGFSKNHGQYRSKWKVASEWRNHKLKSKNIYASRTQEILLAA